MQPAEHDIIIERGTTYTFAAAISTRDGDTLTPWDFTGYNIVATFTDARTDAAADLELELGDGIQIIGDDDNKIHMQLSPAQTASLGSNLYEWQLGMIDPAGITSRLFRGIATAEGWAS